jgi:protein-S-isoprenylcysteine O-methyltransferase Ste14
LRQWVFRWRGYVLVPTAALVVLFCHPTLKSFFGGLLIASMGEALRIWGVGYTGMTTRSSTVQAPALITGGPYAYVRNPLYLGNCVTAFGFFVIAAGGITWFARLMLLGILVVTYLTVYGIIIPLEEEYLLKTFGETYAHYQRVVPRLLPRLVPYPDALGAFDWRAIQRGEVHTLILFVLMCLLMGARLMVELKIWEVLTRT